MPDNSKMKPAWSSGYQYIHERIKWLRQNQVPYMTVEQLATASGLDKSTIFGIEGQRPDLINMRINTLRSIANALGCDVVIQLKPRKRGQPSVPCLPVGPPLPAPPKRPRKMTMQARTQALLRERSPWRKPRPSKHPSPHTETS